MKTSSRLIAAGLEEDRQALQTAVGLLWICKGMAGMKGVFDFGHASAGTVTDAIPVEKTLKSRKKTEEEQLADSLAWSTEDVMQDQDWAECKWERDCEDWAFRNKLLALKDRPIALLKRMLETQEQQVAMVPRAVEDTEDRQVLDTILAPVVSFVPPAAQPPALVPPAL
ncbi:hypothetical protein Y1Q_0020354 [Alligator mississippiensis]|uniref:Uncharacterized protein n=1 Tax=Alligator mississippiensis TaxID=8496 RepID=A0A151N799_ALLMI|nr:hypothetical protein Y1Q_0020354 [Alligator mississippiensis]